MSFSIQEIMHSQRCFSSGTKEEGEGESPFLLSHERYLVPQTRAFAREIEGHTILWQEGEESHVKEE